MKKILSLGISILAAALPLLAVPASPRPFRYTQPDGRVISLQRHGDEFYHWTTSAGQRVVKGTDGFYRPVALTRSYDFAARARAQRMRELRRKALSMHPAANTGNRRCLVILVEFADRHFVVEDPARAFDRQLNETGYTGNGGTGSVGQYFRENSMGAFSPVFDVVGPVRVSGKVADYGGNNSEGDDINAAGCFAEACRIVHENALADFSRYDSDGDGYVDNIFFYYAGFNEAEGSDTDPNEDTIWPHAWSLLYYGDGSAVYDGVRPASYACGSELTGSKGNSMCGIGTFCHEYGHVLGLPDFYDTDGEENGSASTLSAFSLMDGGCYNNDGRTPPHLNGMERWMLGWMDEPQELGPGSYNLGAIQDNAAARIPTGNPGEFYLLEVRNGKGWDSKIQYYYTDGTPVSNCAEGLVVYHVDRSSNLVGEGTAESLWNKGYDINAHGDHPCFTLIPSDEDYQWALDKVPFPGASRVRSLSGLDSWNGAESGFTLSGISYSGGRAGFTLTRESSLKISGLVSDSGGRPITGAEISLFAGSTIKASPDRKAVTGSDGRYSFQLESNGTYTLKVVAGGYQSQTRTVLVSGANLGLNFTMYRYSETRTDYLRRYGSYYGSLGFGDSAISSFAIGVEFSAKDLSDYKGMEFAALEFMLNVDSADAVYAFVDFGSEQVFLRRVDDPVLDDSGMNSVDMSQSGLKVPSGKDIRIGYMVDGFTSAGGYYIPIDYPGKDGSGVCRLFAGDFTTDIPSSDWFVLADGQGGYYAPVVRALVQAPPPGELLGFGIHSIKADSSYPRGASVALELNGETGDDPIAVAWFYDGNPIASLTFTQIGRHVLRAVLTYADGTEETIEQVIEVK